MISMEITNLPLYKYTSKRNLSILNFIQDNPMIMKTFEHEAHSNKSNKIPKGKLTILLLF